MVFFGVDIDDGIPNRECLLNDQISMQDQWYNLTQDIVFIEYNFNGYKFVLDVGYYPEIRITTKSYFMVNIKELSNKTGGSWYFAELARDFNGLKQILSNGVSFIRDLKKLSNYEIEKLPTFNAISGAEELRKEFLKPHK